MDSILEKKLHAFAEAIQREAAHKKSRIRHEITKSSDQILAEAMAKARVMAQERIDFAQYELEKKKQGEISAVRSETRAKLAELKEGLRDALFSSAIEKIQAFTQTPEYESYLIEGIQRLSEGFFYVELLPADMKFAEAILNATGLTVVESREDFLGGFRLVNKDETKRLDASFREKLESARNTYSNLIAKYSERH